MRDPVFGAWTRTDMFPGLCSLRSIFVWAAGQESAHSEHFGHARIKAALYHQVVRGRRLFQVGEVAALKALLVHPHVPHVERTG